MILQKVKEILLGLFSCLLFCYSSMGQSQQQAYTLIGNIVMENDGQPVAGASVQLLNQQGNIQAYAIGDAQGKFSINVPKNFDSNGRLRIQSLGGKPKEISLADIRLSEELEIRIELDMVQLENVQIDAHNYNLSESVDTTTFRVSEFLKISDRTIEEVIGRLPGMQIDAEGRITFKNKPVTRVLLDGDDLTREDYKKVTRTVHPLLVADLQAIENYVENELMKGSVKSEDVAINLRFEKPKVIFGSADVAYGIRDVYEINATGISYLSQIKSLFNLGANRIGNEYESLLSFSNSERNGVDRFSPLISRQIHVASFFDKEKVAINSSKTSSVSTVINLDERVKLNVRGYWIDDRLENVLLQSEEYFDPIDVRIQNEEHQRQRHSSWSIDLRPEFKIDTSSLLSLEVQIRRKPRYFSASTNSLLNRESSLQAEQALDGEDSRYMAEIDYKRRWSNNTSVIGRFGWSRQDLVQHLAVYGDFFDTIDWLQTDRPRQDVGVVLSSVNLGGDLNHRKGNQFFVLQAELVRSSSHLSTELLRATDDRLPIFANEVDYLKNSVQLNADYSLETNKVDYRIGIKNWYIDASVGDHIRRLALLEPRLELRLKQSVFSNFSFSYAYANDFTAVSDYYKAPVLTGVRSLQSSIGGFYNFRHHDLKLGYRYDRLSTRFVTAGANLNFRGAEKGFVYQSFLLDEFLFSQRGIYDGVRSINFFGHIRRFVPAWRLDFKLDVQGIHQRYLAELGGSFNPYTSQSASGDFRASTGFKFPVNFNVFAGYRFEQTALHQEVLAHNTSQKIGFASIWNLSDYTNALLDYTFYSINHVRYGLLNGGIKIVPRKGLLTYELEAKNLLNVNRVQNFFQSQQGNFTVDNSVLGRYIVLRVSTVIK